MFSSILPVMRDMKRNRWAQVISAWLQDWCRNQNCGFYNHRGVWDTRFAGAWQNPLSQWGKRFLAHNLAIPIEKAFKIGSITRITGLKSRDALEGSKAHLKCSFRNGHWGINWTNWKLWFLPKLWYHCLVGGMTIHDCLGSNDHGTVKFKSFGVVRKKVSRIAILDFKKANLELLILGAT